MSLARRLPGFGQLEERAVDLQRGGGERIGMAPDQPIGGGDTRPRLLQPRERGVDTAEASEAQRLGVPIARFSQQAERVLVALARRLRIPELVLEVAEVADDDGEQPAIPEALEDLRRGLEVRARPVGVGALELQYAQVGDVARLEPLVADVLHDRERIVVEAVGLVESALIVVKGAEIAEHAALDVGVVGGASPLEGALVQHPRGRHLAARVVVNPEVDQDLGLKLRVADRFGALEGRIEVAQRRAALAVERPHFRPRPDRTDPQRLVEIGTRGAFDRVLEQLAMTGQRPAHRRDGVQGENTTHGAGGRLRIRPDRGERPLVDREQVLAFGGEGAQGMGRVATSDPFHPSTGGVEIVRVVPRLRAGPLVVGELLFGELAHGLEQAEARRGLRLDASQQRLVAQRLQHGQRLAVEHRLCGLAVEAAAEDRAAGQRAPLLGAQQLPRPVDRRAQRGVALLGVAAAAHEHVDPLVDVFEQALQPQQIDARGGELDREWDSLELAYQRRHAFGVGLRERETGVLGAHAVDEQLDGVGGLDRSCALGDAQGWELEADLTLEPQLLARGHHEADLGRRVEPGRHRPGADGDELLEVVEDDHDGSARRDRVADAAHEGVVVGRGAGRDRKRARKRAAQRLQRPVVRELAEPHAPAAGPAELRLHPRAEGLGEACLPGPRRAEHGDEACAVGEQFLESTELLSATDKAGRRCPQIGLTRPRHRAIMPRSSDPR